MSLRMAVLLDAYLDQMQKPVDQLGLQIAHQLGKPYFSSTRPTLPLGALVFQEDGYKATPSAAPRLGQTPPTGHQLQAAHYLYASSEPELVTLLDRMRIVREKVASVLCETTSVTVRFSSTRRADNPTEERMLDFVVVTDVTFTWP